MDNRLPRWIMASIASYTSGIAAGIPIRFFVEGVDEPESSDFNVDSALLRVTGPTVYEGTSNEEWYKLEVQILLTDIMQLTNDNAYDIFSWAGIFQEALLENIPILQKGDGDTLICCLQPDKSVRNNIRVVNYGQVDTNLRIRQMSVHGKYILYPC